MRAISAALAGACLAIMICTPANAAFPGGNGRIVYVPTHSAIWTVNPDGSGRTELMTANGVSDPAWSADGSRIAFSFESAIWVMNADGTGATRLSAGLSDRDPAWSPDGKQIVFVSAGEDSFFRLWVMNADGSNARPLGPEPVIGAGPDWSPDGTTIAYTGFTRDPDDEAPRSINDIYTVKPDGTGVTNLTPGPGHQFGPDWAPDGSRIVFASDHLTRFDATNIYSIRPDGSDLTRLTFSTNNIHEFDPVWSPDGARIAYVTTGSDPPGEADAGEDIDVMNADGSGARTRLTPFDNLHNNYPDWQPLAPRRSDYKNAAQFCRAERAFLGEAAFRARYGGGSNAHGRCVSGK